MSTYLGQNFLKDSSIKAYIATAISKLYEETHANAIVEIWPWKWAITRKIKDISSHFFVVEKDLTMKSHLLAIGLLNEQIVFWDVLETDISSLLVKLWTDPSTSLAVGNLPYYITSPIFRKLFTDKNQNFLWGIFMIQDEVWQKIISSAQKKSYLWWLVNWAYEVTYLKMVPPKCFSPAPKVKSCLVMFKRKEKTESVHFQTLESFLNLFAPYSRKTLWRIAKLIDKHGRESQFHLSEQHKMKRLEELSWSDLCEIIWKCDQ